MLISLNWVREFCPFETDESALEIGARFSVHAAEVEHAEERGAILSSVLAARVKRVRPHPDADRLTLVVIEADGEWEVVCGAPNVREGMVAPYAPPGTIIQGREIREAKVRGVLSRGMLLSERELGVSEEAGGLWDLPPDVRPGTRLASVFPEIRDVVLEIDNKSLTHRPDLWGHHGIAREFSAIYRAPLRPIEVDEALARAPGSASVRVSITGEGVAGRNGLCRRYCGLQVDGIKVGPSPAWLRHRLLAVGARPISNVVDVTNYVLFEIGQPLHAFDTARVGGGRIIVRRAAAGESIRLLDGSEALLEPEDLVIADARSPVALAGIMGGAGSEISDATTSIFLESANFAPARVRRTSIRIGKRTDSSLRFEKSLDPENARTGILRAARLLLEICPGAKVVGALQDVGHEPAPPIEVRTSAAWIANRLGMEMPAAAVEGILSSLGFDVKGPADGEWSVRVPSWRATKDISIREDLVEEVGRIHGYGRITPFAPTWKVDAPPVNEHRRFEREAKQFLTLHGALTEVFTYSMVGEAHCRLFGLDPEAHLKLKNPITEDMDRLRREIVPLHLEKARENQRYSKRFGFFEVGRVYRKPRERLRQPGLPDEGNRLSGLRSLEAKRPENFHETRDIVLALLERLRVARVEALPPVPGEPLEPWAHPAVFARILVAGRECGRVYRVHPETEARLELKGDVMAFDVDFDAAFASQRRPMEYHPPCRYPLVPFDVAIEAGARTTAREVLDVIRKAGGDLLRSIEAFDVFQSEKLGAGKKSMAFHLVFGSDERTLEGDEIKRLEEAVVGALRAAGYPLRT